MSVIARWKCEDHGEFDGHKTGPSGLPRCPYRGCTLVVERVEYVPAEQLQGAVDRVEELERMIGEAYARRGPNSTQVLRELFGKSRPATTGGQ